MANESNIENKIDQIAAVVESLSMKLDSIDERLTSLEIKIDPGAPLPGEDLRDDAWLRQRLGLQPRSNHTESAVQPGTSSISGEGQFGRDGWGYERNL